MPTSNQDLLRLRRLELAPGQEVTCRHDATLFLFAHHGAAAYRGLHHQAQLSSGDALVFTPDQHGTLCGTHHARFAGGIFSVSLEHLTPLFATAEIPRLHRTIETFRVPRTYPASTPVAQTCHRLLSEVPTHFGLDHRVSLLQVAARILSHELGAAGDPRASSVDRPEHLSEVFDNLSIHNLLNLPMAELARHFKCSERHLNRLFHERFGMSVSALRMEIRVLKAVALLRDPRSKVIDIAAQCGFNQLSLFNRCFKRRFSVTPGQWRKAHLSSSHSAQNPLQAAPDCSMRKSGLCPWSLCESGGLDSAGKPLPPSLCPNRKSTSPSKTKPGAEE